MPRRKMVPITVAGQDFQVTLDRQEYLQENCSICIHRNPVIFDELLAEPVPEQQDVDRYPDVRQVEAMSPSNGGIILKI